MKKKITVGHTVIIVILIFLAILCFYPMWFTLIISLSNRTPVDAGQVWIVPKEITVHAYEKILGDSTFFNAFWVSVKRVLVGCSINMALLIFAAYPLCVPEKIFPAGKYYKWFFVVNMLFNGGMIPTYMLIKEYRLFNSLWALVLPCAVPLWMMIYLLNFFKNVPYELNESATIDGANPLQILCRVYIPLSKPSLACILLYTFVDHWNAYFDGLIYINDVNKQPLQTYIYQLSTKIDLTSMTSKEIMQALTISDQTMNAGKVMVAMAPILLVYPIIQKYFISGMTLGAVKG